MSDSDILLSHQPCSKCGSSDAKTYYMTGSSTCFGCGVSKKHDSPDGTAKAPVKQAHHAKLTVAEVKAFRVAHLSARGISEAVTDMFNVKQSVDESTREPEDWFMPYWEDNEVVGYKARKIKDKIFYAVGKVGKSVDPFGWHRVSPNGKLLIITEGELDALAATEMLKSKGKDYKVISIPLGAQSAQSYLNHHLSKFEKFEKIILNFDNDEAGLKAAKESATCFQPGQCYVMTLPDGFKDANDLLLGGSAYQYLDAINQAKEYRPDGIVSGVDTWDIYNNRPSIQSYPFPDDWIEMNRMAYGIRLGELDVITSGTSAGKTQLAREMIKHYLDTTSLKIGILSLEEPITDTIESYIALACNKRIHLPDVDSTEEERHAGWLATLGSGRMELYDAFGGEEVSVLNNIRYMAKGAGCQLLLLDHLHMLLDGKDSEKDQIERVMLKLKKLTQELGVWIGLIAHLKKSGGESFEEGGIANLDDLKGSSSIKQLANGVYILGRNQQADDYITKNTTQIVIGKCRFTGRSGYADRLIFSDETGRMTKLKDDDIRF